MSYDIIYVLCRSHIVTRWPTWSNSTCACCGSFCRGAALTGCLSATQVTGSCPTIRGKRSQICCCSRLTWCFRCIRQSAHEPSHSCLRDSPVAWCMLHNIGTVAAAIRACQGRRVRSNPNWWNVSGLRGSLNGSYQRKASLKQGSGMLQPDMSSIELQEKPRFCHVASANLWKPSRR